MRSRRLTLLASSTAVLTTLSTGAAIAQQSDVDALQTDANAIEQGDIVYLDKIVLSAARKVEEPIKDVPIKVDVIGAQSLVNVPDPEALTRTVTNFSLPHIGDISQSSYVMRGVGALVRPLNSLDSTVGFSYDGAPSTLLSAGLPPLDIQRIEVLRGPQGTLYGRGTLAGAVNYLSNTADGIKETRLRSEFGSDGHRLAEIITAGTLIEDRLFGRAALRFSNFDGDIPNGIIGGNDGDRGLSAFKGTLRYVAPDSPTEVIANLSYFDESQNAPQFVLRNAELYPRSGTDIEQKADRKVLSGSVTVTHELDFATFTSLTAANNAKARNYVDITDSYFFAVHPFFGSGTTPATWNNPDDDKADLRQDERMFSQEFRLNSLESAPVLWLVGLNVLYNDYQYRNTSNSSLPLGTVNGAFDNRIETTTYAAFGEVSVPVSDKLKLGAGLRLARDEQTFTGNYTSNGRGFGAVDFSQRREYSDTYAMGRVNAIYDWSDAFSTYASIARGHSSGGFSQFTNNSPNGVAEEPFDATISNSYEIGAKYFSSDGTFYVTAAAFLNDVKNGATFSYDAATAAFAYVPYDYETKGFELEAGGALSEWLDIKAGIGRVDARLVDVPSNAATGVKSGNRVPNVANWTANLALDARYALAQGDVTGRLEYQYAGDRAGDPADNFDLPSYGIVNLSIGYETDRYSVYAFARNLADERYESFGSYLSDSAIGSVVGQGRTIGLGVNARF